MSSVLLDCPFFDLSFTSCVQCHLCYWIVHSSVLVSRLVFTVVCVTGVFFLRSEFLVLCSVSSVLLDCPFLGLSFTSCVQCRLCYWIVHSSVLVSRLVFSVVCVTGGICVAHLSFTSCVQCRLCYWRDPCCST
jgi:hypothetical protein